MVWSHFLVILVDQALIDPVTGDVTEVPWQTSGDPAWQRLAP